LGPHAGAARGDPVAEDRGLRQPHPCPRPQLDKGGTYKLELSAYLTAVLDEDGVQQTLQRTFRLRLKRR
jgi:hypothetical protein